VLGHKGRHAAPPMPRTKTTPNPAAGQLDLLYRGLLESALDCIIIMDAKGSVLEFNAAAERTFGFTRAEAIGAELAELIIPERMRDQHRRGLKRFLETGEGPVIGKRIQIAGIRKDGSEILVELAITVIKMDNAPIFTAYLRDITERQRSEETARRLAAVVESSDDAIIGIDLNGIITNWNAGAENLFGYKNDEIIGKPVTAIIPTERQGEELRMLERIRRAERVEHYETIRCRKDRSPVNVSLTISPIKDSAGAIVGASKISRDISERVQTDRRRNAQYRIASLLAESWTLGEAAPKILETLTSIGEWVLGALWIYDETVGRLRCSAYWHEPAPNLEEFAKHSQSIEFVMGQGLPGRVWKSNQPVWIQDVTIDDNFPRGAVARESGLRGGFAFPLFAGRAVNGVIEMFSHQLAAPDPDLLQLVGALGSQIGLFIERRRIEKELQREKENAEAANAAKDRFLATLSHELRTPLTPVLIWAGGTVTQPGLSPEMQEGLKMVCRNVELEARLIDDLLDLTRLSRGKLQLQLRSADIHELVRHTIEIVRKDIEDRHLHLSISLQAAVHEFKVDPPRVQQVFWNVLRNACKFTPEEGAIAVRTHNPAPETIAVEISDSGAGIPAEFLDKIFEPFEQVDRRREGLGLGLAISKAIVEMHGGSIRARSEGIGRGSTFIIKLRATESLSPAPQAPQKS
jgi:two-component system CheB/CheR fusion protein